ncbi:MAG: hypothetical protein ACRELF_13235 [Gemmataceae bacterium]
MKVSVRDAERYAMKALEEDQKKNVIEGGVQIFKIGEMIGMSREDSQDCVEWMRENGWVSSKYNLVPPMLTITKHGREEIAKLKRPRWYRWIDKHPGMFSGLIAAIVSGLFNLLAKLLEWWLR